MTSKDIPKIIFLLTSLLISSLLFTNSTSAGIVKKVRGYGETAIVGITPEQGWRLAIMRARANAIEKACGIHVFSSTLVKNAKLIGEYIQTLSRGFIIKEKVIKCKPYFDDSNPPIPHYKVTIEAEVSVPIKQSKKLLFDAKLNKNFFLDGEKAKLTISAYDNIYPAVFNITANDKVIMLYPNRSLHLPLRKIKAGKHFIFPPPCFDLKITVIKGHKEDTEAFFIVAIPAKKEYQSVFERFVTNGEMEFVDFFSKYADISDVAQEKMLLYSVRKSEP